MSSDDQVETRPLAALREFKPGQIIGGCYKIKSLIGRGGMGVVYLVEHQTFHRDCALKALAPERVTAADWQRFQNEGKAIAKLDHPNIVKVYDLGSDGPECLYYVMDLLQGRSLDQQIKADGALDVKQALEILSQTCAGLGYGHKLGLIHRDVKPSNIILCNQAGRSAKIQVKIIDYGLVKLLGDQNQDMQSQTATGKVCGSPHYMSPEQCLGGKVDQRSDIYSLGCTIFEALTGRPPFTADNPLSLATMHETQAPPRLRDLVPGKDFYRGLEQLLARMLEKSPAMRYQTMEQVIEDIDRVRRGQSLNREAAHKQEALYAVGGKPGHLPASKKGPNFVLIGLLSLAVLAALGWTGLSLVPGRQIKHHMPEAADPVFQPSPVVPAVNSKVRDMYENWPRISNGIVNQNGVPVRLFNFPPEPVGYLRYGNLKILARGVIRAPANEKLYLTLEYPAGVNARRYPNILSKIGPQDINTLELPAELSGLDNSDEFSTITPALVRAIKSWTGLHALDLHHDTLPRETILAMDEIHPVPVLKLHSVAADSNDLANLSWLDQVQFIDLKRQEKVDPILYKLRGSTALKELAIDYCDPSREALSGLQTCKNLESLRSGGFPISDDKLAAVCNITQLKGLAVFLPNTGPRTIMLLHKLKNLEYLDPGPLDSASITLLRSQFLHCEVRMHKREWDQK